MDTKLKIDIADKINRLECLENVKCVLLYGSLIKRDYPTDVRDADLIIVLHKMSKDAKSLMDLIFEIFPCPDFHIYTTDEIMTTSFFTREYVLEYLAKGECLYGENPFVNLFDNISYSEYRQSLLIRSIEHVQMVRKIYFSNKHNEEHKLSYLAKYIKRLSKNILLFKGLYDYDSLNGLSVEDVLTRLVESKLLKDGLRYYENSNTPESLFALFSKISEILIQCRKEIPREKVRPGVVVI